jgi:hypothetical protein
MKHQVNSDSRVFDQYRAILTNPGLLGPCARATTEQPWGQNGHIKNNLER